MLRYPDWRTSPTAPHKSGLMYKPKAKTSSGKHMILSDVVVLFRYIDRNHSSCLSLVEQRSRWVNIFIQLGINVSGVGISTARVARRDRCGTWESRVH
jgi:hypothetical protein